jgi:hypothetical protein
MKIMTNLSLKNANADLYLYLSKDINYFFIVILIE